jgi:pyruvate/2-oxoglutarate/acetoin dehydrogenase E1 component
LTVVVPAFPDDTKGLTIAALQQDGPVVIVEHRALYGIEGKVPEVYEATPIGKARRVREGRQITIVGTSFMVQEALHAADELARPEPMPRSSICGRCVPSTRRRSFNR